MIGKKNASLGLAVCLTLCLLSGCAALLERSYGVSEPYADRYWDSSAEDTLRVESYQDLVNSLLLLVEQRAEEGIIRCYGEAGEYAQAMEAKKEVCKETMLGSYFLKDIQISYESGPNYSTLTCQMHYREDAADIASIMTLSDSQSLVDLLRLAVREGLDKLTARFAYDTPKEEVIAAVESLWQELCRAEMEQQEAMANLQNQAGTPPESELAPEDIENSAPEEDPPPADSPDEPDPQSGIPEPDDGPDGEPPENTGEGTPPGPDEEPVIVYPPCPWAIRFYPNQDAAEMVEVLLK